MPTATAAPPPPASPTAPSRPPTRAQPRRAQVALVLALVLGGLSAGFFVAYEVSVTVGLAIVDDVTYVTAFQALNATIRNAAFAVVFFGAAPATVVAAIATWGEGRAVRLPLACALVAQVVVLVITFAGNIPLNEQLAAVDPAAAATSARAAFEGPWNALNLARTAAAIIGLVALAATAIRRRAAT